MPPLQRQVYESVGAGGFDSAEGEGGGGWLTYGASLVAAIVENIHLVADNVHIRYEDEGAGLECPLAAGIHIQRLTVQSTTRLWV